MINRWAYQRRDGQAESARVAGFIAKCLLAACAINCAQSTPAHIADQLVPIKLVKI